MPAEQERSINFMRIKQVAETTGLSKSSVYDLIKNGDFPRPVKISEHRSGWVKAEVDAWSRKLVEERDAVAKPKAKRVIRKVRRNG